MHFLFFDESYPRVGSGKDIVVAAWAVEQEGFEQSLPRLQECYRLRRIKSIASVDSMLKSIDAWAVVARASLDSHIFRTGEVDSTDDVAAMARTDTIWSVCGIFLVGSLIKELIRRGIQVGAVDIYHDPKCLKVAHAEALGKSFHELNGRTRGYEDGAIQAVYEDHLITITGGSRVEGFL